MRGARPLSCSLVLVLNPRSAAPHSVPQSQPPFLVNSCSVCKCVPHQCIDLAPAGGGMMQVTDFKHGTMWPIMIVSYETLRKFADSLAGFCDILVCDEGHRYARVYCLCRHECNNCNHSVLRCCLQEKHRQAGKDNAAISMCELGVGVPVCK